MAATIDTHFDQTAPITISARQGRVYTAPYRIDRWSCRSEAFRDHAWDSTGTIPRPGLFCPAPENQWPISHPLRRGVLVVKSAVGCVFVIGMHRSGTSATAEMLGRLGLALPSDDELIPATRTNERGHFESKTLVRLNERLLTAVGGTWSAPPPLPRQWELADSLHALRREARASFAAAFPRQPALWKDPRNCLLLPFWRTVLEPLTAAVFVYRDPLEVARSLQARDGFRLTHGLALWERYLRAASANLEGVPTLCTDFRRVLDDPVQWSREAVEFLTDAGLAVDAGALDPATSPVDAELRHQRATVHSASGASDSQRAIFETLRPLDGPHQPWRNPDLGTEPDWVSDVLAMGLEVDTLDRAHRTLTSSAAYRLASAVTRIRQRVT
jgi:hypothetical protein